MNKFLLIVKNTWSEFTQYRLNFIMWRVRNLLKFLVVYFLWLAILSSKNQIFGYEYTKLITYILLTLVVSSIVFSTRTQDIGSEINQGDFSNLLLKPINTFSYWISRDIGDKILNISFSIVEFILLFLIFRPDIFFQLNFLYLLLAVLAVFISIAIYFLLSLLLSFFGFWTPDVWGPRFLFLVIMEFFAGGLFPLDILPNALYRILNFLPFSYLIYFPIKIYLGQLTYIAVFQGLLVGIFWVICLIYVVKLIWQKGLINYQAYGK